MCSGPRRPAWAGLRATTGAPNHELRRVEVDDNVMRLSANIDQATSVRYTEDGDGRWAGMDQAKIKQEVFIVGVQVQQTRKVQGCVEEAITSTETSGSARFRRHAGHVSETPRRGVWRSARGGSIELTATNLRGESFPFSGPSVCGPNRGTYACDRHELYPSKQTTTERPCWQAHRRDVC